MMSIKKTSTALVGVFLFAGSVLAQEPSSASGDVAEGKIKSYTCTGCHGIPGYMNAYPSYRVPKIGGQNYEYLVIALEAYRAGTRKHPTMQAQAGNLTDEDIADISAYFVSVGEAQE